MTKEEAKTILYEWLEPKDNKTVSSDDFSEAIETLLEEINFVDNLVKLREQERKVKLPELIDLWWMQEDRDGNRLVETKEHFASAMKKAYSIGLSHKQTSIPEPASEDLEKEIGKYTTNHLLKKRNHSTGVYHLTQKDCDDIASHFADWQKKQMKEALQTEYEKGRFDMREEMMKDAIIAWVNTYESVTNPYDNEVSFITNLSPSKFKNKETVKIIICKNE